LNREPLLFRRYETASPRLASPRSDNYKLVSPRLEVGRHCFLLFILASISRDGVSSPPAASLLGRAEPRRSSTAALSPLCTLGAPTNPPHWRHGLALPGGKRKRKKNKRASEHSPLRVVQRGNKLPGKQSWPQGSQCSTSVGTTPWDTRFHFQVALCGVSSWTQGSSWVPSNSGYSV